MSNIDNEFFKGKRPWSKIKDKVLQGYMPAYLRKVAKLRKPILLIDGYAGPGVYEEDQEIGSPIIMCGAAEKYAPNQYKAIFVNHNKKHHERLKKALSEQNWFSNAKPILGDASTLLEEIASQLYNQTVFIYLDPFGLKGCEFATLEPFLSRNKLYSTEIVLNVSMPITHRLAAVNAVKEHGITPRIASYHKTMTKVFGGDYWKDIYFSSSSLEAHEKERLLLQEYRNRIAQYLPFTGSCPVREDSGSRIKYFITFASRHADAMLLMNDEMCKAYFGQMHEADFSGTLFEKLDWKDMRTRANLEKLIIQKVTTNPGSKRQEIWLEIVREHFMQFTSSEYKRSVDNLVKNQKINVEYTSTRRLNDHCKLFPANT